MKKRDKLKKDFECLKILGVVSDLAYKTNMKEVEERLNKSIENSKRIIKKNNKRSGKNNKDFMDFIVAYLESNLVLNSAIPL